MVNSANLDYVWNTIVTLQRTSRSAQILMSLEKQDGRNRKDTRILHRKHGTTATDVRELKKIETCDRISTDGKGRILRSYKQFNWFTQWCRNFHMKLVVAQLGSLP